MLGFEVKTAKIGILGNVRLVIIPPQSLRPSNNGADKKITNIEIWSKKTDSDMKKMADAKILGKNNKNKNWDFG